MIFIFPVPGAFLKVKSGVFEGNVKEGKYDKRFAFTHPVVSETTTLDRSKCVCEHIKDSERITKIKNNEKDPDYGRVAFLTSAFPKKNQTFSEAIASTYAEEIKDTFLCAGTPLTKEENEAGVRPESKINKCNKELKKTLTKVIEEASDILFVSVNRVNSNGRRINKELLEDEIYITVKGQKIRYSLIGGCLQTGAIKTGHYTAILKLENGSCIEVNDDNVVRKSNSLGFCKLYMYMRTIPLSETIQKFANSPVLQTSEQAEEPSIGSAPLEPSAVSSDAATNIVAQPEAMPGVAPATKSTVGDLMEEANVLAGDNLSGENFLHCFVGFSTGNSVSCLVV